MLISTGSNLGVIHQENCPIDAIDDVADEEKKDRGNEEVVEVEPLKTNYKFSFVYFYAGVKM